MKNDRKIIDYFAVPVIQFKCEKHDQYVDKWPNWDRRVRQPDGWQCDVNSSFPQLTNDDPYIDQTSADELEKDLLFQIKKVLGQYNLSTDVLFHAFWYNAYYEKQGQESHMHLSPININPTWSGIYFAKNCFKHQLSFHRNDFSIKSQGYFDVSNSQLRKYYEDTVATDFADGDIVLFPPHLHHSVRVGKANEEQQRLTFSFNLDSAANIEFRRQTLGEGAM